MTSLSDGASRTIGTLRRIHFADTSLALDIENSSQIYRLYQAAFDRKPDLGGLGYWLDALDDLSLEKIASQFIASAEFQALYGVNPDDQQFLNRLYKNVLHRPADAGGLAFWIDTIRQGVSRTTILINFSDSAENKGAIAPSVQEGITYAQKGIAYRPVASAGKDTQVNIGSTVWLDGSASTDANGDILSFAWSMVKTPAGSKAALSDNTSARPSFIPDAAGSYTLSLLAKDSTLTSRPATIVITALALAVTPVADTGIYKCSQISAAMAQALYAAGHTYLDRDHDGKPCEANDIRIETPVVIPTIPTTPAGQCWVNGYTRKNGTYVHGYWRRC